MKRNVVRKIIYQRERAERNHNAAREIVHDIFGNKSDDGYESSRRPLHTGPLVPTFMSSNPVERPESNIGLRAPSGPYVGDQEQVKLKTAEDRQLEELHDLIGTGQENYGLMKHAPLCIEQKVMRDKLEPNWDGAHEQINWALIPRDGNVISPRVVFEIKVEEKGKMRLKARLCSHSNQENMKENMLKN